MTEASPERVPEDEAPRPPTARVLPFERPQNPLQRAVQERAQEQIERQRLKPRIGPVRLLLTLAVALLPVVVLLGAADAFVRGIHLIMSLGGKQAQQVQQAAPEPAPRVQPAPVQQPGVVLLVPPQVSGQQGDPGPSAESAAPEE